MKSASLFLLAFAFSSIAGAATMQTIYIHGSGGAQKPTTMPAPADSGHYAAAPGGSVRG